MALGDAGGRSPAMMAARREAFTRPIGVGAERQRPSRVTPRCLTKPDRRPLRHCRRPQLCSVALCQRYARRRVTQMQCGVIFFRVEAYRNVTVIYLLVLG